jgi:hypothetical protein
MQWNDHSNLEGLHATFGASNYHWINYDVDKMLQVFQSNKAKQLGIDYIATGHYAKVEYSEKYNRYVLKKSNNIKKDQSYFLYVIPKEILDKVIFPLSDLLTNNELSYLLGIKLVSTAICTVVKLLSQALNP